MGGAFVGGAAMGGLSELSKLAWVGGEGGKDHPLLVVGATQHLVIVKVEVVSNTEPVPTLLAGETLKMVNIGSGSHHHLKGGNLSTSSTVAGRAKESEVVALAQQEVPLRVKRLTNLSQSTIATSTFEAILMPILIHRLQDEFVMNLFCTASTLLGTSLPCSCHPYAGDHPPPLPH